MSRPNCAGEKNQHAIQNNSLNLEHTNAAYVLMNYHLQMSANPCPEIFMKEISLNFRNIMTEESYITDWIALLISCWYRQASAMRTILHVSISILSNQCKYGKFLDLSNQILCFLFDRGQFVCTTRQGYTFSKSLGLSKQKLIAHLRHRLSWLHVKTCGERIFFWT